MPCDTMRLPGESLAQRKESVRKAVARLDALIRAKAVEVVVDKATGAVAFRGWTVNERDRVSDACAYRRLLATGSNALREALVRAEAIAGRAVDPIAVGRGAHSHDGGHTWHDHKG